MGFRPIGEQEVARLIRRHLEHVVGAVEAMAAGVQGLLEGRAPGQLAELAREAHDQEGRADEVRRQVELALVRGASLASRRGALLRLVEGEDRLANAAEAVMDYVTLQGVTVPELLRPLVAQIIRQTQRQTELVKLAVEALLEGSAEVTRLAEKIEHIEGRVDELERRCTNRLFSTELPLADKLLVRDFIGKLVEISDRAEDLSDLVFTIAAARR